MKTKFRKTRYSAPFMSDWLEPVPAMKLVIDPGTAPRASASRRSASAQMLQAAMSGVPLDSFRDGEETVSIVAREPRQSPPALCRPVGLCTHLFGGFVPVRRLPKVVPVMEQGIEWRRRRLPTITVRGTLPDGVQPNDVAMQLFDELKGLREGLAPRLQGGDQGGAEDSAESQASIAPSADMLV